MYVYACPVGAINIGFTTVETSNIAPREYVPRATGTSSKLPPPFPPLDDRGSVIRSNMYRRPVWFFRGILRRFSSLVRGRKKGSSDCCVRGLANERIREMNREIFDTCTGGT